MTTDAWDFEERSSHTWEPKVWGEVTHVFDSPHVAISVLRVKAGFRCSRHCHRMRANAFMVLAGKIEVWEWLCSEGGFRRWSDVPYYRKILTPSRVPQASIESGKPHMFRVIESGLVVEIYTPDGGPVEIEDIVRFDEGGPDELA